MLTMTMPPKPEPVPASIRAQKSRSRRLSSSGATRVEAILQPDAATALVVLLAAGYAPSATAAISRALIEAAGRAGAVAPSGR